MAFDALVANAGRLRILSVLAAEGVAEFVTLRERTCLTDGNLSAHARRLEGAGLVASEKRFRDGRPVTSFRLTGAGREALERHARELMAVICGGERAVVATPSTHEHGGAAAAVADDDWVD
jgi:DNA-binding MarR family transcriptional regulator